MAVKKELDDSNTSIMKEISVGQAILLPSDGSTPNISPDLKASKRLESTDKLNLSTNKVPQRMIPIPASDASSTLTVKNQLMLLSANANITPNDKVDLDQVHTEGKTKKSKLRSKTSTWKRVVSSNYETDKKDLMIKTSTLPSTSQKVSLDQSKQANIPEEDDQKISDLKNIINQLSQCGTSNSKELLNKFENIIGTEGFLALKTLFTENLLNSQPKIGQQLVKDIISDSDSECDDLPSAKRIKTDEKPKARKKKKTEVDKLNDDIMEMFIRDGVLSASGLRQHKKVPYVENDAHQDFEFDDSPCSDESMSSEDDESINCHQGSLSSDKEAFDHGQEIPLRKVEAQLQLDKCFLIIPRLNLDGVVMPAKIFKDGSIHKTVEANVLRTESKVPSDIVSTAKEEDSKLPRLIPIENPPSLDRNLELEEIASKKPVQSVNPMPPTYQVAPVVQGLISDVTITIDISDDEDVEYHEPLAKKKSPNKFIKRESPTQANGMSYSKTVRNLETFVYNLSYVKCRAGYLLKCNCEKCDYVTYDYKLFEYHIQTRHLLLKWSGSCKKCGKSVHSFGSLLDEYNHMDQVHIKRDCESVINKRTIGPIEELKKKRRGRPKKNEPKPLSSELTNEADSRSQNAASKKNQSLVASSRIEQALPANTTPHATDTNITNPPNKLVPIQSTVKTMLKLRCLPGDKLSSASNKNDQQISILGLNATTSNLASNVSTTSEKQSGISIQPLTSSNDDNSRTKSDQFNLNTSHSLSVQNQSTAPNLLGLQKNAVFMPVTASPMSNAKTKFLQPWLTTYDSKNKETVDQMVTKDCLTDKYKCMGSSCCFHSNDSNEFLRHLRIHERIQAQDALSYGRCAYCSYTTANVQQLVQHLQTCHKYDKYQCTKCFYRSVVDHYIFTHQQICHNDHSKIIFECNVPSAINFKEAVEEAKESRKNCISPIMCVCKFTDLDLIVSIIFHFFYSNTQAVNQSFSISTLSKSTTKKSIVR